MPKKEAIPTWVKNLDAYEEYLKAHELFNNSPERYITCPSGKTLTISNSKYLKQNLLFEGFSQEEVDELSNKINFYIGKQIELGRMKQKAAVLPNQHYRKGAIYKDVNENNETLMLELFGRWFTPTQVHKELLRRNIDIRFKDIEIFNRQNKEKIREVRNKISEDYDDLPIGVKRSRLEKLNYLLNDLYNDYEDTNNQRAKIELSKEIRAILDQARKEVEGEELKLTVNGRIDVEATISLVMKNSVIMQDLTVIQMVMSRVCQRVGIPYNVMVHRLANSHYAKYAGLRRNDNLNEKPVYPSTVNYDILDMRPKYEEWQRNQELLEAELVEHEISEPETVKAENIRESLLNKLNVSRERIKRIETV